MAPTISYRSSSLSPVVRAGRESPELTPSSLPRGARGPAHLADLALDLGQQPARAGPAEELAGALELGRGAARVAEAAQGARELEARLGEIDDQVLLGEDDERVRE